MTTYTIFKFITVKFPSPILCSELHPSHGKGQTILFQKRLHTTVSSFSKLCSCLLPFSETDLFILYSLRSVFIFKIFIMPTLILLLISRSQWFTARVYYVDVAWAAV